MWIIAVSTCSMITFVVVVALCSCWKRQRQKEDWLGLAGMVKQTNPDENVNHIPLSSSNAAASQTLAASDCIPEIVVAVADAIHCDAASKRPNAQTNTRRSLPDIPSETVQHLQARVEGWDPSGDNSSELYATVEPYANVGKRHTLPNGLDTRPSISQHSSISQADDAPYASVNYDKLQQLEHPYAIVKPPQNPVEVADNSADAPRTSLSNGEGSAMRSDSPSAVAANSAMSRRNSTHSIQMDINVASAVAGGVAASQDLPYMTPPIHTSTQQVNFSGDSQDSSKGYTSISVREPLASIIAQTKKMNKPKRIPDPHYSTVSDDSDEMYTTIPDALNQEYTSESETYAQIQPVALTVAVDINPLPSNLQMSALVEQSTPIATDETAPQPPSVDSLRNVTGSHSRQGINEILIQNHFLDQHVQFLDGELFASLSTSSILNLGSPKPEKRQANSPLPPPPMTPSPSLSSEHQWKNLDDMYAKVHKHRKKSADDAAHKRTSSSSTSSSSEEKKLLAEELPANEDHNYETLKKSPTKNASKDTHGYEKLIPKHFSEPGYASINGPDSLPYDDPNYEKLKDNTSIGDQIVEDSNDVGYSVVTNRKRIHKEPGYISMPSEEDDAGPNYESVKYLDVTYERLQPTDTEDTDSVNKNGCELIVSTGNLRENDMKSAVESYERKANEKDAGMKAEKPNDDYETIRNDINNYDEDAIVEV